MFGTPEVGSQGSPVRDDQKAGECYYLRVCGCGDCGVSCRHLPAGSVEDVHPPAEILVMLTELTPLLADVLREREPDHGFIASQPADQAQMLFVRCDRLPISPPVRLCS